MEFWYFNRGSGVSLSGIPFVAPYADIVRQHKFEEGFLFVIELVIHRDAGAGGALFPS